MAVCGYMHDVHQHGRNEHGVNAYDDADDPDDDTQWTEGRKTWNYLDYLMEQIPGKNNYGHNLTDALPDGSEPTLHYITGEPINSAYYTRYYRLNSMDAMGTTGHRRGYSDRYLFAAQNTQEKVSPIEFTYEKENDDGTIEYIPTSSRWSYAIPFEIIYMTPLTAWNPHGIEYFDKDEYDDSRTGGCTQGSAYTGWTEKAAYFTPSSFFQGLTQASAGDTVTDNIGNQYDVTIQGGAIVKVKPLTTIAVDGVVELNINSSSGRDGLLYATIDERPEYQGEVKQQIDCVS